ADTREEAAALAGDLETALLLWVVERTSHTAAHLLQKAGIPAAPVQDSEDIWRDPQLRSRDFMVPVEQIDFGVVNYPQSVQRLSQTPGRLRAPGPRLGEHTHRILREWLGTSDAELHAWEATGAIFQAP